MRMTLLLALIVAGCAAPAQNALNQAMDNCSHGDRYSCRAVPQLRAQAAQESINNQAAGAAFGAALGAAILNANGYYDSE